MKFALFTRSMENSDWKVSLTLGILLLSSSLRVSSGIAEEDVDPENCLIWGPGLKSHIVLPVRYFYIQVVDSKNQNVTDSVGEKAFSVNIYGVQKGSNIRAWVQVLDRHDGSYIVRYKPYESAKNVRISITYNNQQVAKSPYDLAGMVYHEKCDCPAKDTNKWLQAMECPNTYSQIDQDLAPFKSVDTDAVAKSAINRFNKAGMHSLCQYRIIDNKIYRKTYGEHVGFKMFMDNILLSITRKVTLPDMEFFTNLGDWPLEKRRLEDNPIPLFSWCGSEDSMDIIMPTYDVTESTLEMMGRTTLDLFSVQANTGPKWENKTKKGFWRGRDSRQERLDLTVMGRQHPDLIDSALTHMFFFPKDDEKYGQLVKSVSFFDFFKYKYQINIDGTVAAYRLPYLLAGDTLVLKQESPYYEFFYRDLQPDVHYVPFKRDLSNLLEKLKWAKNNDDKAQEIAKNGQEFVRQNLQPASIFCYHVILFQKFAKLQKSPPKSAEGFEFVPQPDSHEAHCDCHRKKKRKEEL